MSIAVVVPTRDRCCELERTLDAVRAGDEADEIVVVDDGSIDGTAAMLADVAAQDRRLRVVQGAGRGAAKARQLGLETATADVVLFLDDDVVPHRGSIVGHRRHHETSRGRVVLGYMPTVETTDPHVDSLSVHVYAHDYEAQVRRYEDDPANVLRDLWGGNVSLRREDALTVGVDGPVAFAYHEDKDFGLRCAAAGLHGVFDRSLRAEHHPQRSFASFVRLAHAQGMDLVRLHAAHPELGPLEPACIGSELPRVVRAGLTMATWPGVGAFELRAVSASVRMLSVVGPSRARNGAAVVARAIAQRRGVRDALRYPDAIGLRSSSTDRPSR